MVDVWLLFSLVIPFVEVLIQTRIEYLRGKIEESQTINHHGKTLEVIDGKVVGVSDVGSDHVHGNQNHAFTPVVPFDRYLHLSQQLHQNKQL